MGCTKETGPGFERWFSESCGTGTLFRALLGRGRQAPRPGEAPPSPATAGARGAFPGAAGPGAARGGGTREIYLSPGAPEGNCGKKEKQRQATRPCKPAEPEHSTERFLVFNKFGRRCRLSFTALRSRVLVSIFTQFSFCLRSWEDP